MSSRSSNDEYGLEKTPRIDYFGDQEASFQKRFSNWRSSVVAPAAAPFQRIGVTPGHITLLGVAFSIPYAICFFYAKEWTVLFLALYVLMDGLDGAYARVTKQTSSGGALSDVVADQLGMFVSVVLVIQAGLAQSALAAYYLGAYIAMIALSVAQNFLQLPMQPIIRTKYLLYVAVLVWSWFDYSVQFDWLFGIASAIMTFTSIQSFVRLKRGLDQIPKQTKQGDD
ncbi:MAG: CDP-alcohol phosphatidyltransferase family protein [Verrucomicrobiota bacterium]